MGVRIADSRTGSSRSSYIILTLAIAAVLVALSGVVG